MITRLLAPALCLFLLLALPSPARAAPGGALGDYWGGFLEYWEGVFRKQNGVVMGVLVVGAVALFIITRGKWRK